MKMSVRLRVYASLHCSYNECQRALTALESSIPHTCILTWRRAFSVQQVQQIDRVVEVVEETVRGNVVRLMAPKRENGRRAGTCLGVHVGAYACTWVDAHR